MVVNPVTILNVNVRGQPLKEKKKSKNKNIENKFNVNLQNLMDSHPMNKPILLLLLLLLLLVLLLLFVVVVDDVVDVFPLIF